MLFEKLITVVGEDGEVHDIMDESPVPVGLRKEGEGEDQNLTILERTVKYFADQAFRTLLVSYRDMSMDEFEQIKADNNNFETHADKEVLEDNLCALGIFGLMDPLRDTVPNSIRICQKAGIKVIMCTGDNIDTAIAISKNAGIITEEQAEHKYSCMTGKDFREYVGGLVTIDDPENPGK